MAVYERSRTIVRSAPLVRARGRLERREEATNIIVAEIGALEAKSEEQASPASKGQLPRSAQSRRHARERAVAELREVAPSVIASAADRAPASA